MLIRKVPMRIKFVLNSIGGKEEKNHPGRWTALYYILCSMNNVRVGTFLRQRRWFWWNHVVVFRFRITKWPTGMPYRICDHWLLSVFFYSSLPVFYSRYIYISVYVTAPYARRTGLLKVNNTAGQRFLITILPGGTAYVRVTQYNIMYDISMREKK